MLRTYGEAAGRVARMAGALKAMGLAPGERVAIVAVNNADYFETLYAVWHAGLAAVPANAKLHGAELGYILAHSGARVCFARTASMARSRRMRRRLERMIVIGSGDYESCSRRCDRWCARAGDDLAWLFYTSGTTGRPKGAMLTHC